MGHAQVGDGEVFSFDRLPAGLSRLSAPRTTREGTWLTTSLQVELRAGESRDVVFGADPEGVIFAGRLLVEGGQLHAGARLRLRPLFPWDELSFVALVLPDSGGRFLFEGLRPGKYAVDLRTLGLEGVTTVLGPVELHEPTHRDLTVSGTLSAGDLRPPSGCH